MVFRGNRKAGSRKSLCSFSQITVLGKIETKRYIVPNK